MAVTSETSRPQDLLIRKWLVLLAKSFYFDLPGSTDLGAGVTVPSLVDFWVGRFRGYDIPELQAAFEQLADNWRPDYGKKFPVPGDLTAILRHKRKLLEADLIERSWHGYLELIRTHYHPDIGWRGKHPDPPTQEAAQAAGGLAYLWQATDEQLLWAKKSFVEHYQQYFEKKRLTEAGLLPASAVPPMLEHP